MISSLAQFAQSFAFDRLRQIVVVNGDLGRLLVAKEQHERLRGKLLGEPAIDALLTFRDPEED
jgi:hypothetical protein